MPDRHLLAAAALSALLATACASGEPPISTAYDPLTPFPARATYVWDEAANVLPSDLSPQQLEIGPLIQEIATDALAARGYTLAKTGEPPYRVSYELVIHTWISEERSSSTASLALRMGDYLTNKPVWKGFTRIEVNLARTPQEREKLLRDTFARMLEHFPPGQG